ncbi:MAG TPA: hypothetical protein VMI75_05390 [Polyangiaceae bacterium]|nr:hypothetical protein [Polyangiaceae bacterium]
MKPIRATAPALILTSFAALTQLTPACNRKSFDDYPPGNDASSDGQSGEASSGGGGLGDDGPSLDDVELGDGSSGGGGNCALPSGTFAVTATPDADADPTCMAFSTMVTFPPSIKPNDAGVTCSYTATGSLPICAVSFTCQGYDDAAMVDTVTGYIEVDGTSIEGTEEIMSTGDGAVQPCNYRLSYVKQ